MMHKTSLERSQFVVIHDHYSYFYIPRLSRKENLCNMFCLEVTFFFHFATGLSTCVRLDAMRYKNLGTYMNDVTKFFLNKRMTV